MNLSVSGVSGQVSNDCLLPEYQKNMYEGTNITPRPSTKDGIPYNDSFIFNALNNKNANFSKSENDNGKFVNISFLDDNGRFISHQLSDYDKDGKADSYQLSIWEDSATREFWNDDDLDGKFDIYGKEIFDSESEESIAGLIDFDTDGTFDSYDIP